jgi:pyruvate dehydrogenase E1 component alpha subunit
MDNQLRRELYGKTLLIRRFEEKILEVFSYGKLAGSMFHVSIGEEAVAAGVVSALEPDDYITSNHRGHGHFIAKGADLNKMMAELYGKQTGYCHGKGGSMHIADVDKGHLGANGIVGGGFAIATGAGYSAKMKKDGKVSVCFFGDGASNEGLFHESLNMAGLWKLPVLYVCENNLYAMSTPFRESTAGKTIAERAAAYGMAGEVVDGNDAEAVYEAAKKAVARARAGEGPTLLECSTYRHYGHSRGDVSVYRTREEEAEWKKRDPIKLNAERLIKEGVLTEEDIAKMEEEIASRLEEACAFADESPYPPVESMYEDIYYDGGRQ